MKYEKTQKYNIDLINQKIMGPNPLKLEEELLKDNKIKSGSIVMDLGSGQGITSIFLVKEYGFKVWDGPSLSAHIKKQYAIDIGVRQCQRLFRNLGYSHIRPQPYPSKGYEDTDERVAFKKTYRN